MTQQEEKLKRIKLLLSVVEAVRKMEFSELYGRFAGQTGITRKTFLDYLRSIQYNDNVKVDWDNEIVLWVGVVREQKPIKKVDPHFQSLQ